MVGQKNPRKVIEIVDGVARHPAHRMDEPVNFTLYEGEHLAIVGPNGAGKTTLVNYIVGRYPLLNNEVRYDFGESNGRMLYENLRYIAFRDSYGDYDSSYYYQQRWHSQDVEQSPVVREVLGAMCGESKGLSGKSGLLECPADLPPILEELDIRPLMDKQVVMLSSGELRRLQMAKTLLTMPRVLIVDNPFIGLDPETRGLLCRLLQRLASECELQLILVLSREEDVPAFITRVVSMRPSSSYSSIVLPHRLQGFPMPCGSGKQDDLILSFSNVTLRYGSRTILDNVSWEVHRGERWALGGRNGSGKSALLSLVCADNPQAYACDISLFGRRRGSGESIWDIKRRIGYVSPEMHRSYLRDLPAIEIVASGLHDSVGLYVRPRPEQMKICEYWMNLLCIDGLKERTFLSLSSGEQRLVLLARAFVKNPELLILDEPFHGLDSGRCELVRNLIDAVCAYYGKTLIMVTHYTEELPSCITHYKQL